MDTTLLSRIKNCIGEYSLLPDTGDIAVALSGGKDSLFLILALRALGYSAHPFIVDVGYVDGWGDRVSATLRLHGIASDVLRVRAEQPPDPSLVAIELGRRVATLDRIGTANVTEFTPCTHCYSAKVLALAQALTRKDYAQVCFGHHRTDAYASLLKSALMYVDRWDDGHQRFARLNYAHLATNCVSQLSHTPFDAHAELLARVEELVTTGKADTDEPPRQDLLSNPETFDLPKLELIRPLFGIHEYEIRLAMKGAALTAEPSSCQHGATTDTETPREIIQHALSGATESFPKDTIAFLDHLLTYGIMPDGRTTVQARRRRAELLGESYRPPADGGDKL